MTNQITVWFSALISLRVSRIFLQTLILCHGFPVEKDHFGRCWSSWLRLHKPEQELALLSFLQGHNVFVSLLTGYRKSLCYTALPGAFDKLLKRTSPGSTSILIALSPLIALIKDQVASLLTRGLAVGCITHESSDEERVKVKDGQYQLVLFSPEALLTVCRWRELLQGTNYRSFIVDEAHCVKKINNNHASTLSAMIIGACAVILVSSHMSCSPQRSKYYIHNIPLAQE